MARFECRRPGRRARPPVTRLNAGTIVGLLAADHAELGELFRALLRSLDEGDSDATFARLDVLWARLAVHIRAENLHLFPAILRALETRPAGGRADAARSEGLRDTIERLRRDHDTFVHELMCAVKTVRALRDGREGVPAFDSLPGVRSRIAALRGPLERHNREEERVYPAASAVLDSAERNDVTERVRRELENLPPRLRLPATRGPEGV
jgi:hemerythrin-like domain-containing protein